jgi:ATP-dependent protease ClpP protease subunit
MTTIDIHESANFNLASEKQYVAIVVKNTRLTAEEVRKMMRDGRAVTAEEAIKMGLADKILQEQ